MLVLVILTKSDTGTICDICSIGATGVLGSF